MCRQYLSNLLALFGGVQRSRCWPLCVRGGQKYVWSREFIRLSEDVFESSTGVEVASILCEVFTPKSQEEWDESLTSPKWSTKVSKPVQTSPDGLLLRKRLDTNTSGSEFWCLLPWYSRSRTMVTKVRDSMSGFGSGTPMRRCLLKPVRDLQPILS